jgi:hypothetical protein
MEYKNLVVVFKDDLNCEDDVCGTHKVDYTNASIKLSSNYLIITEHSEDRVSLTGKIYPLKSVVSYKGVNVC